MPHDGAGVVAHVTSQGRVAAPHPTKLSAPSKQARTVDSAELRSGRVTHPKGAKSVSEGWHVALGRSCCGPLP